MCLGRAADGVTCGAAAALPNCVRHLFCDGSHPWRCLLGLRRCTAVALSRASACADTCAGMHEGGVQGAEASAGVGTSVWNAVRFGQIMQCRLVLIHRCLLRCSTGQGACPADLHDRQLEPGARKTAMHRLQLNAGPLLLDTDKSSTGLCWCRKCYAMAKLAWQAWPWQACLATITGQPVAGRQKSYAAMSTSSSSSSPSASAGSSSVASRISPSAFGGSGAWKNSPCPRQILPGSGHQQPAPL